MLTNKIPWIILLGLWMAGSTWWHVCKIKQLCVDDLKSETSTTGETEAVGGANGLMITDGDRFRLELPGNFSFSKSGAMANMNSLGGSLDEMVAYLKANPGRTLEIKGYYSANETNSTSFPNLGIARAEGLRQYLVQQGIPAESIATSGEERNLTFTARGDSLLGGLDFAFGGVKKPVEAEPTAATASAPVKITTDITENELANKEKFTSVFKPIDLYFQLGESNYIKTEDTKKFFGEAIHYLAEHKDKKLLLTGYTDSSGPDDVNMRLSRDRANDVKARLQKSGVASEQIVVQAKGETEPKADNSTLSGRKANRRVTVVVQ